MIPAKAADGGGKEGAGLRDGAVGVVIPAAGSGTRMGGVRKPFLELDGVPLLRLALEPFLRHPRVAAIRIALPSPMVGTPPEWLRTLDPRIGLVQGGVTRGDSVRAGLRALPPEIPVVLVHDGARPFVDPDLLDRLLAEVRHDVGAVPLLPIDDTVKEVDAEGWIRRTVDRSSLRRVQTPQAFPRALLLRAHREGATGSETDDAMLVEEIGGRIRGVAGHPANLKVTRIEDLPLARFLATAGAGPAAAGGAPRDRARVAGETDGAALPERGEPFRILFVCTGNTCRSPMAEGIARALVRERGWHSVEIRSGGLGAAPGVPATDAALEVAAEAGIDLSGHRSRGVSREEMAGHDLILVMSRGHLAGVRTLGAGARASLLGAFAHGVDAVHGEEVQDPFGAGKEVYRTTFLQLHALIRRTMDRLAGVVGP